MKKIGFLLSSSVSVLCGAIELPAPPAQHNLVENEMISINNLIRVTESNLVKQKEIREEIKKYHDQLAIYLKNSADKEIAIKTARAAYRLLDMIKSSHLEQNFASEFISELTLFSQIAQKSGMPKL